MNKLKLKGACKSYLDYVNDELSFGEMYDIICGNYGRGYYYVVDYCYQLLRDYTLHFKDSALNDISLESFYMFAFNIQKFCEVQNES